MKSRLSILFIVLYAIALVRPAYPLLEYYFKLEEYKQSCINKSKPQLHCNGKCVLMQRMKALHQQEPDPVAPAPAKINFEEYPVSLIDMLTNDYVSVAVPITHVVFNYTCFPDNFIADIFRPPSGNPSLVLLLC
jgi:hypothetical protein